MTNELSSIDSAYGASRATQSSYVIGFILSIILTLIPYTIATNQILTGKSLLYFITFFALLQLLVQLFYFLHLNSRSKARWNLIAIVFTIFMVAFLVIGTIWIMQNLNEKAMLPSMNNQERLMHGD